MNFIKNYSNKHFLPALNIFKTKVDKRTYQDMITKSGYNHEYIDVTVST